MKTINKILLLFAVLAAGLVSCTDDEKPSLELGKDAYITEFSIDGIAGEIDRTNMEINVVLPPGTDVTILKPSVKVSDGASVTPLDGMVQNFTNPVTYTVVNGNIYNEYTVTVEVIDAYITTFVLDGKYQGSVNNSTRTIRVTIPNGTDLSALETYIVYTEGATLTPDTGSKINLNNPVTFTLSYRGSDFVYSVILSQRDEAFAFVGDAADIAGLPGEEKAAAEWMMATFNNARYVSLESIRNGSTDLSDYDVIWWHYHSPAEPFALPGVATDAATVQAFRDFLNGGGGLALSTFANEYAVNLGLTEFSPFNKWGNSEFPIAGEPGEWGISGDGRYDHPIFDGLPRIHRDRVPEGQTETGVAEEAHEAIMLQSRFATRTNKACIWNLQAGETIEFFTEHESFERVTGAKVLASFDWDASPLHRAAIVEFERVYNGRGPVICNGAASYEWWNCGDVNGQNEFRDRIEKLTENIINHLRK